MPRKKLNKNEMLHLVVGFRKLLEALGKFQIEQQEKRKLTKGQIRDLEDVQWTILNTAIDLNAEAVLMKTAMVDGDLKKLTQAAKAMKSSAAKIQSVKKGIRIASKAIAFGGGIVSGNVNAAVSAGEDLIREIKKA